MRYEDDFEDETINDGIDASESGEEVGEEEESASFAEPIAVVGFAGRFPGARDVDQFWVNLRDGVESVRFFTDEELLAENIDPAILKNPRFVRADAILDDIDLFDADFFNYSPREAEITDPQHRLFLEVAWEAMESAGYNHETYPGRVGVFGGSGLSSYLIRNLLKNSDYVETVGSFQTMLANSQDFLTTKVSYKMNLMGPSVNVNTLCSSSMVGVHLACQSLWNYQTDMNLAGGVSIQSSRNEAFFYQEGGIGAFDGHCRAFDERAGGTVSGSGLGVVVLKRMEDALADGDTIHALVRGSAINNDGSVKLSYTAPSIDGQAEVIGEAMALGGIDPATISYVECHGTGTSLGDPIEIAGLTKAFRAYTDEKGFCAIGSVKTNIGHLVTAGGVASMIKTVMALKHRQIPPSLNYERPNPKIDFASSPFFVNTELRPWVSPDGGPLRAGVSSFGIGGTNAHLILEEAPAAEPTSEGRAWQLIPFSARTETALEAARTRLASHLAEHPELSFEDAAYTMRVGRKTFNYRGFVVAQDAVSAVAHLQDPASREVFSQFQEHEGRGVAFLFSGQGSQYIGMARGIYESEPVFRTELDRCAELLKPHLGLDIRQVIWPKTDDESSAQQLQQTAMTQPALFCIAYAQASLFRSWGVQPEAMLGHSIGEYVAACLAGVFSLEDALMLVSQRGRLINSLPSGDMLAVPLAESALVPMLTAGISLAAVNGRTSCVVSGTAEQIDAFRANLAGRGVEARILHTSHAFHSHMMDPILTQFADTFNKVALKAPELPFVSNVTGTWITPEQATDPQYWVRHLRGTVRFHDGLGTLLANANRVLLEVGPGNTLSTLARQFPSEGKRPEAFASIRHPREKAPDAAFLHQAVGHLWVAGVTLDWTSYHEGQVRRRVVMPTYPFERRRFWVTPDMHGYQMGPGAVADERVLGIRKDDMADWAYVPAWQSTALPRVLGQIPPKRRWLVFGETRGFARALMSKLQDEGQIVVNVAPGQTFSKLEHGLYQVRLSEAADYNALVADLQTENLLPDSLLFFPYNEKCEPAVYFANVVNALTALGGIGHENPMQLSVVTHDLWSLDEGHQDPSGAMLAGLLRVVPHEYPHVTCRMFDLAQPKLGSWREARMVQQLLTDLTGDRYDAQVAYRGSHRFVRSFQHSRLEAGTQSGIREGGTYLILGGLSGAGLKLAQHIASHSLVNLVLTTDREFPDHSTWDKVEPAFSDRVQLLREFEKTGHRVLTRTLDSSDPNQLHSLLDVVQQWVGDIHGVIFSEGPAERELLAPLTAMPASSMTYLTWLGKALPTLESQFVGKSLDFFILLSSTASELGGLGLATYAAANAYMDSFVSQHNASNEDQPWTSLNWDGWLANADRSAGMGERHTRLAISWEEGYDLFDRVVSQRVVDQLAISTEDLPARMRSQSQDPSRHAKSAEKVYALHARPSLTNAYVAPRTETERKIAEIWQKYLGIETVGINDNYFDLGGDSLLIVKIRRALQEAFGGDLLTSDLFEHPTVGALATFFDQSQGETSTQKLKDRAAKQRAAMEEEEELMRQTRRRGRR